MIFDSLTHATEDGSWFSTNLNASITALLTHMSEFSVEKSILSGLPTRDTNLFILSCGKNNPKQLIPIPMLSNKGNQEIRKECNEYKELGAKGFKIHPRLSKISLDDKKMELFFEIAQETQLPLFICTVMTGVPSNQGDYIYSLSTTIKKFPNVKTVLLHGGYINLLPLSEAVRPLENVLIDLSATLPRFYDSSIGGDIKFLFRTFEKRICLGSDFPEYSYDNVYSALDYLGLVDYEKDILGGNLERFLSVK